jgi:hypothetical protein
MAAADDDARRRAACHNVMQAAGRAEAAEAGSGLEMQQTACSRVRMQYVCQMKYLHWSFTQGCSYAASKTLRKDKSSIPQS